MKNFTVKVPATSANIGAGFDCMGLALDLYNETRFFETLESLKIITDDDVPADETNLVYRSMQEVFSLCNRRVDNIGIRQINRIPQASGLGSSAACVVTGVYAANVLLGNPLCERELVELCTRLDSHPDNVVPCIKGGVSAGATDNGRVYYTKCCPHDKLTLVAATPDFGLKTEVSRKVLPDTYSREDVVFSLQRAVVTFAALTTGDVELLRVMDDRLHTPYRKPLIRGYDEVETALKDMGALAVYLSGAGPTVMGMFSDGGSIAEHPRPLSIGGAVWTLRKLNISAAGVTIC